MQRKGAGPPGGSLSNGCDTCKGCGHSARVAARPGLFFGELLHHLALLCSVDDGSGGLLRFELVTHSFGGVFIRGERGRLVVVRLNGLDLHTEDRLILLQWEALARLSPACAVLRGPMGFHDRHRSDLDAYTARLQALLGEIGFPIALLDPILSAAYRRVRRLVLRRQLRSCVLLRLRLATHYQHGYLDDGRIGEMERQLLLEPVEAEKEGASPSREGTGPANCEASHIKFRYAFSRRVNNTWLGAWVC